LPPSRYPGTEWSDRQDNAFLSKGDLTCRAGGHDLAGFYPAGQPLKARGQSQQLVTNLRKPCLLCKQPQSRSRVPTLLRSRRLRQPSHGSTRTKLSRKTGNGTVNGRFQVWRSAATVLRKRHCWPGGARIEVAAGCYLGQPRAPTCYRIPSTPPIPDREPFVTSGRGIVPRSPRGRAGTVSGAAPCKHPHPALSTCGSVLRARRTDKPLSTPSTLGNRASRAVACRSWSLPPARPFCIAGKQPAAGLVPEVIARVLLSDSPS
jgi:hypothetical protein